MADIKSVSTDRARQPIPWTLRRAIRQRNPGEVRARLNEGANPNDPPNRYMSPLQSAAEVGDAQIVSLLLEAGADPKWTNVRGWSALTTADAEGFEDIASILLAAGADPETRLAHGYSNLHRAVLAGDMQQIVHLSKQSLVDSKDSAGNTPLMLAIRIRDLHASELLLKAGADPNANIEGWSILAQAAYEDAYAEGTDLVELLLAHGADPRPGGYPPVMAAISQEGSSIEVIELLLAAGGEINAAEHETTLHRAASMVSDTKMLLRLVRLGADLEARDSQGRTPLLCAVESGNDEGVSGLLDSGADMTAVDPTGHGIYDFLGDDENSDTIRQILNRHLPDATPPF